jgi:hypothetical protein
MPPGIIEKVKILDERFRRILKISAPSFRGAPVSALTRVFDALWARTRNRLWIADRPFAASGMTP